MDLDLVHSFLGKGRSIGFVKLILLFFKASSEFAIGAPRKFTRKLPKSVAISSTVYILSFVPDWGSILVSI